MTIGTNAMTEALYIGMQRVESLLCSDSNSSHFGCADRDFWAYRTTRGFPSSPFQHVMGGLAYLSKFSRNDDGERTKRLALAALDYWSQQRNTNGSANEWYRNEQSYCATAMGLHAACETLFVLRDELGETDVRSRCVSLQTSARWLAKRDNLLATNQRVASITGRFLLGSLLNNREMCEGAVATLKHVEAAFADVGFLPEYGGMDIGYTLLSIDLFATAHRAGFSECEAIVDALCTQLSRIAGSSERLPFELGSRGSHHHFFGGVLYFAKVIEQAHQLAQSQRESVVQRQCGDFSRYDDRYLATFGFTALARRAALEANTSPQARLSTVAPLKFPPPPIASQPFAGGTLFAHEQLGGALSWCGPRHQLVAQLGYVFTDEAKRKWTTLVPPIEPTGSHIFTRVSDAMPLIRHELTWRAVFALCRISTVAAIVSRLARTRAGRPTKTAPLALSREVSVSGAEVIIEDLITVRGSLRGSLRAIQAFPFHSPSLMSLTVPTSDGARFVRTVEQRRGESEMKICWKLIADADNHVSVVVV